VRSLMKSRNKRGPEPGVARRAQPQVAAA